MDTPGKMKNAAVSFEYMRSLSGTLDLENLSGCFDILVDIQIGMNWVEWNLNSWEFEEMSDLHSGQGEISVSKKGEIFKELVILLAPSVHGWITTCFVCCLLVAQQVLAPYSGGFRRHFYPNVCFKRMNITLKCFHNFAYVPFVKFCV